MARAEAPILDRQLSWPDFEAILRSHPALRSTLLPPLFDLVLEYAKGVEFVRDAVESALNADSDVDVGRAAFFVPAIDTPELRAAAALCTTDCRSSLLVVCSDVESKATSIPDAQYERAFQLATKEEHSALALLQNSTQPCCVVWRVVVISILRELRSADPDGEVLRSARSPPTLLTAVQRDAAVRRVQRLHVLLSLIVAEWTRAFRRDKAQSEADGKRAIAPAGDGEALIAQLRIGPACVFTARALLWHVQAFVITSCLTVDVHKGSRFWLRTDMWLHYMLRLALTSELVRDVFSRGDGIKYANNIAGWCQHYTEPPYLNHPINDPLDDRLVVTVCARYQGLTAAANGAPGTEPDCLWYARGFNAPKQHGPRSSATGVHCETKGALFLAICRHRIQPGYAEALVKALPPYELPLLFGNGRAVSVTAGGLGSGGSGSAEMVYESITWS